jgi:hypothetical protein
LPPSARAIDVDPTTATSANVAANTRLGTPAFTSAVLVSNALTMDARRRGGRTPRTSAEMTCTKTPCCGRPPVLAGHFSRIERSSQTSGIHVGGSLKINQPNG